MVTIGGYNPNSNPNRLNFGINARRCRINVPTIPNKERHMITRVFLDHPHSVDESYLEHARFAGGFSLRLFGAACAALVHAAIPCLFERTASTMIAEMYQRTHNRGR